MSDDRHAGSTPAEAPRTAAKIHRTRWPGWIWAVPIAAIGLVAWLGIRHIVNRGPEVTVTFDRAAGLNPGGSKVEYRGVNVGTVEDVELAQDLKHIVVTLSLHDEIVDTLREGTRFWIAGANPEISNLSSFKAMITGPHIEMEPGPGKPTRTFTGLMGPPAIGPGASGTSISLTTGNIGPIRQGSIITYLGLEVGVVTDTSLTPDGKSFVVSGFIRAPYDRLVHTHSRFWKSSGVQLEMGSHGVTANLPTLASLVSGGIAFNTPDSLDAGPVAKADAQFRLYGSKDEARDAPVGETVSFLVRFDGMVGDLTVGAAVKLKGFRIGEVTHVGLDFNRATGEIEAPVTIAIEPQRFDIAGAELSATGVQQAVIDAMDQLVRKGYRARLDRSVPVVGGRIVTLAKDEGARAPEGTPAHLIRNGSQPEIPASASSDIGAIAAKAGVVMSKIDSVPIAQIGYDIAHTAHHIETLTSSPEIIQSLDHLDNTLTGLDKTISEAGPKVSATVESLRRTAEAAGYAVASAEAVLGGRGAVQDRNLAEALKELSDAARAVGSLANYLERHPEALVQGRAGAAP